MGKLNDKQQRFVEEYIKDLNATQAAIRAEYSEETAESQGSRLLSNAKVAEAIQKAKNRRSKRTEVSQDKVIKELARLAFSDLREVARWHADNIGKISQVDLIPGDKISTNAARALSEISTSNTQYGTNIKVKMHSKTKALELLCKHLGITADKLSVDALIRVINEDNTRDDVKL